MQQLKNTINHFNKIILDELKENNIRACVAGGAVRDYFMGVFTKTDYDLFFPDEKNLKLAIEYFKSKECEVKWESDNGMKVKHNGKTFDLIKKIFGAPEELINEFDFTVSMFAVDNDKVYYGESSFIDLCKRQLMLNKVTYPASTLSRAFRYYQKGFKMCSEEMKKLVESIQNMPKQEEKKNEASGVTAIDISEQSSGDFFAGID